MISAGVRRDLVSRTRLARSREHTDCIVVGDKGKKIVIHDEGKFDSRSIPLKNWSDYE
jgi:hypothetical protein